MYGRRQARFTSICCQRQEGSERTGRCLEPGAGLLPRLWGGLWCLSCTGSSTTAPSHPKFLHRLQPGAARSPHTVAAEDPHFLALITPTGQNEPGSPTGLDPTVRGSDGRKGRGTLGQQASEGRGQWKAPRGVSCHSSNLAEPGPRVSSAPRTGWSRPPPLRRRSPVCARPPSLSQRLLARVPSPLRQ